MIRALMLAFAQLSDPRSRRVVWIGVAGAVAAFVALLALVEWALTSTTVTDWSWVDTAIDVLGGVLTVVLAWILFPAVAAMVSGLLLEEVVARVEQRHYPRLPPPLSSTVLNDVTTALRFLLVVLAANIVALPLYLAAPGLNLLVFYTINGYLLGREYFELVANRRLGRQAARDLRRTYPLKPFLAGVIIAFLSTVPVVNLLVPVVASAFMVHVFHTMRWTSSAR
ncbi:MAG TPA: EI24 domain-containing protein [Azospirillum sp.]|nr:EI24 domain-containing protein [Azospirillum sp.]